MPKIDPYGNGMTVLIDCEATGKDNFLAFASWYSLFKNLPDAKIIIACQRPRMLEKDVFTWVRRINVSFFYYRKKPDAQIVIPPDILCLGPLNEEILKDVNEGKNIERFIIAAKSQDHAVFCSIKEGCGSFVPDGWIHKEYPPFDKFDILSKGELTTNEKKVFKLWEKLCPLFNAVCQ